MISKGLATIWTVLLTALVSLAVGGAGTYWYLQQEQPSPAVTPPVSPTTQPSTPSPSPSPSPSSLQTYSNTNLDFSFQYPEGYTIAQDKLPKTKVTVGGISDTLVLENEQAAEKPKLTVWYNPDGFGPVFSDIHYNLRLENQKFTIVERRTSPPDENNTDGQILISALSEPDTPHFYFLSRFQEGGKNYEDDFKKVIETFKLTE